MDRRYRRLRLMIGAAIASALLITGGATAAPVQPAVHAQTIQWSNPAALAPGGTGVTPQVSRIELGDFDRPQPGVNEQAGVPAGLPLALDAGRPNPSAVKEHARTLTVVRASTAPFSAAGVSWKEVDRVGAVNLAVRGHVPGGDWGAWHAVGPAEPDRDPIVGPTAGTQPVRGGAELAWLGPSDGVEMAITLFSGKAPHDIAADLIDPASAAADANPPAQSNGAASQAGPSSTAGAVVTGAPRVAMPPVFRRAAWGADEREMTWRPQYAPTMKAIDVRATFTGDTYAAADVPRIIRAIYQYQAVSLGWGDIGYNVLVDKFGRLWEGRAGGLSRAVIGAQAGGLNAGTAGLAFIGDYATAAPPAPAQSAAAQYAAWKFSLGPAADPRGTVGLVGGGGASRYKAGSAVTVPRIFPEHQTEGLDSAGSGDPAKPLTDTLPTLRTETAQLLGGLIRPETIRSALAVWRPSDATYRVAGNATPLFTGKVGDRPVPADYDGDGHTDLATFDPAKDLWTIKHSSDGTTSTAVFGQPGDRPVPADYDGDGHADLAVWRPATAEWVISNISEYVYGAPGDVPVPADYTGDGAADPAVWRPSTGVWYMRGAGQFDLGEAWHVPTPADFNGDGVADPAAYSPVTHKFFIRGEGPVAFGTEGDVPVPDQYDGNGLADFAVLHVAPDGRAVYQIRGHDSVPAGVAGDVPVPLR